MSNDMNQTMHDFKADMNMMVNEAPTVMKALDGFMNEVLCNRALDSKTKELIALGMAITASSIIASGFMSIAPCWRV